MLSPEQRAARRTRIGASEVAALLEPSEHPYTTPARIYERIVEGVETESNARMRVGQRLEPAVLALARQEFLLKARACHRSYVHPYLPVCASPDAYLTDGEGLVEVKVTSALWTDQPPRYVIAQVQCQLWLAHRSYAQVVVLQGSSLRCLSVQRDGAFIARIEAGVRRFWERHLRPLHPPTAPSSRDFELRSIK